MPCQAILWVRQRRSMQPRSLEGYETKYNAFDQFQHRATESSAHICRLTSTRLILSTFAGMVTKHRYNDRTTALFACWNEAQRLS